MRSHISLSGAVSQMQACLHFQQTLSIEASPILFLLVNIETLTGLGYTMTGSILRESSSTFNDDVNDKTKDSFTQNN